MPGPIPGLRESRRVASRKDSQQATETLEEIEGVLDKAAEWATTNPILVLGVFGSILAVAAAIGGWDTYRQSRELAAADQVGRLLGEYRGAMGAEHGDITVTEPANPETARAAREQFAGLLEEAAAEHSGSTAAVEARIHAGNLRAKLGEAEAALAQWRLASDEAPRAGSLQGLALVRLASGLEDAGQPAEAAAAFEQAAGLSDFGDRRVALADAARCYLDAGDRDKALALAQRLESEADESPVALPEHVEARLTELRLRSAPPEAAQAPPEAAHVPPAAAPEPQAEAPEPAAAE